MLAYSVKSQSNQIFQNIEILLDSINENDYLSVKGGFKTWKHFYHLIHSLDKNFINPSDYIEPEFHKKNLDIINYEDGNILTKDEIQNYYQKVKIKIIEYLDNLNDKTLEEIISYKDLKLTKMELFIAQIRHIFFHIGYLHCCIKIENGQTPEYIGIYKSVVEK